MVKINHFSQIHTIILFRLEWPLIEKLQEIRKLSIHISNILLGSKKPHLKAHGINGSLGCEISKIVPEKPGLMLTKN